MSQNLYPTTMYLLYDRFFSLDETTGNIRTFWHAVGNQHNCVVQLHESFPVQTLNYFGQNIMSLYLFCKPSQCNDFEKHQLIDIHRQYGSNLKIFKYDSQITLSSTLATLTRNLDNIQNIFMMHTRLASNLDIIETKECMSQRILYKICFNTEKTRADVTKKIRFNMIIQYPDIEMFIPFDDECELFLNNIFPTKLYLDNTKYTYMSVVLTHYMNVVPLLETFYGLIQVVNARNISCNVMSVTNREPVKNIRTITNIFLDNVPIVDILLGRVYENEHCIEFNNEIENELTFIMIKIYVLKRMRFVTLVNTKYQIGGVISSQSQHHDYRMQNIVACDNEMEMLTAFYNLYTNGLMLNITNMDVHFILATQRYKSNSFALLSRIMYHRMWQQFASHCVVSEDGKCIRFNRNSIILFDNLDKSTVIHTNYNNYINRDSVIYLPELYRDSMVPIESSLEQHIANIKPQKNAKYMEIRKYIEQKKELITMSLYDMITILYNEEKSPTTTSINYNLILESIIELSNRIRIPITLLYSLSVAQIAYRLIFYTNIRNGIFLIMESDDKTPHFYSTNNREETMVQLKNLRIPQPMEMFQHALVPHHQQQQQHHHQQQQHQSSIPTSMVTTGALQSCDNIYLFQNLIKKFIPIHMTGSLIDNYFSFFCASPYKFPLMSSLVDNEKELLQFKNAIIWSRQRIYNNKNIISFDFTLYNSSLLALFGLDFHNCAIMYGFELKSFFYNIFPSEEDFDENQTKLLQLPHTFIMDNDTLKIHNIQTYNDIDHLLIDTTCYIVIMRFITSHLMKKQNSKYQHLGEIFQNNIRDLNRYQTRLTLHKNILNSICGMLSSYHINTTLLNILNALSRKIMQWIIDNCLTIDTTRRGDAPTSIIDHRYNMNDGAPENLISIENDSFTYIYDDRTKQNTCFQYEHTDQNMVIVDRIRQTILQRLSRELTTITTFDQTEILQIIGLKVNFITRHLYQIGARQFFYFQYCATKKRLYLVCNERNNRSLQTALVYLNESPKIIELLYQYKSIKFSHLRRTHNFIETRRLLIWYMMQQQARKFAQEQQQQRQQQQSEPQLILTNLGILNGFVQRDAPLSSAELMSALNLLLYTVHMSMIDRYFQQILCSKFVNLNFKLYTIPDQNIYEKFKMQIPSDKKLAVQNFIDLFFKLYAKSENTIRNRSHHHHQQQQQQHRSKHR